ncbi:LPS export ABC transporter permease LptF [Vibrio sp. RC27]
MIIVRYLIKETVKSQLAIFFILFMVFLSQKFITILASASDGEIPARLILTLVALNMPSMAVLMLPLSLFLGILITFGRLYAESEITVMKATGIGNRFLIRSSFYLALITMILAGFNSLWLSPWSENQESQVKNQLVHENSVDLLQQGRFQTTPDGSSVIFIDSIDNKQFQNVFVAQITPKDSVLPSVMFADSGDVKQLSDGRQIITLYDGTRYEGVPTSVQYMISDYKQYDGLIGQTQAPDKKASWRQMPTLDLMNLESTKAQAEFHWRLALVICVPLLTLFAVPLSAVNPRQGRFAKLGPAILACLTYFLALSAGKSAIESGSISSDIGLWPVHGGLLLAGLIVNAADTKFALRLKQLFIKKKVA